MEDNDYIYEVKWISFNGRDTPIILQNKNGPCPLIAICNVLILRGDIDINLVERITGSQLIDLLADRILPKVSQDEKPPLSNEEENKYDPQRIEDSIIVLQKLQSGIDVNVKFLSVSDFEYTPEIEIFDLLSVRIYHGWLIDPQNCEIVSVIANKGYNQVVEFIISGQTSADDEIVNKAYLMEEFITATASQLTEYGLLELLTTLNEGELCVLFRNNHFSTLLKREGKLYQLVTDAGYYREEDIVWETLQSVDGASEFLDADFRPLIKPEIEAVKEVNVVKNIQPIKKRSYSDIFGKFCTLL